MEIRRLRIRRHDRETVFVERRESDDDPYTVFILICTVAVVFLLTHWVVRIEDGESRARDR